MGAGEHQRETPVGDGLAFLGRGLDFFGDEGQVILPGRSGLPAANAVSLAAAGHGEQPGIRIVRHAIGRPHA